MCGECYLTFNKDEPLDINKYHSVLREIKGDFMESHDGKNRIVEGSAVLRFYEDNHPSNVFLDFYYECRRHSWHHLYYGHQADLNKTRKCRICLAKGGTGNHTKACWKLYWNPYVEEMTCSDVHGRCIPPISKEIAPIWKRLSTEFPDAFQYRVTYSPENGNVVHGFEDLGYEYYSDESDSTAHHAPTDFYITKIGEREHSFHSDLEATTTNLEELELQQDV